MRNFDVEKSVPFIKDFIEVLQCGTKTAVTIHLQPEEAQAVKKLAASQGVPDRDLIYQWVREKLQTA